MKSEFLIVMGDLSTGFLAGKMDCWKRVCRSSPVQVKYTVAFIKYD